MGNSLVPGERRRALRVPVQGDAVLYTSGGPLRGAIENLSHGGALVSVASRPLEPALDLEIKLAGGGGWASARIVRVEPNSADATARPWRVAVAFERADEALRGAIDGAIRAARGAARERPIFVIDENSDRKRDLIVRLSDRGMTPIAPRTPLEAIDLLTRSPLHSGVLLLAPGFGVPTRDLRAALSDSFPWLSLAEITDDLEATTRQAISAWNTTPIAQIADAA
ncbi:MAG TPA: PilZ domain-containing protein [Kofleriaceae bacterium]|nr:PilZ domain-containing protein [Kofleriaceae bacterium]